MAVCTRCGCRIRGTIVCTHGDGSPYAGTMCVPCAWGWGIFYGMPANELPYGPTSALPRPGWFGHPKPFDLVQIARANELLGVSREISRKPGKQASRRERRG